MLRQLYIKNFALIDTLDMQFQPGFSVITGETGAGKSIILGAINLLLGQRADSKLIKAGSQKCIIEAHFDLSRYDMKPFFDGNDIEYDPDDCILRREINAAGKSRAFINDSPAPLSLIRQLGEHLIDIHSQHQNLMLGSEDFQMQVLDIIAQDKKAVEQYNDTFRLLQQAREQVKRKQEEIQRTAENEEFLRFQYRELDDARLEPGMQQKLEEEADKLNHVEDIKTALYQADSILSGAEQSVVERLREAAKALDGIRQIYPEAENAAGRMDNCYIELKDVAQEIAGHAEEIDFEPGRLQQVNDMLDRIYSLEQKHHTQTVEQLIDIRDGIRRQLENIDGGDGQMKELLERQQAALANCQRKADALTETRKRAAAIVEEGLKKRLVPLGIPNVRFCISIERKELAKDGQDKVCFLFSANTSGEPQPVSQVASGGEIARVMLSLKAMISSAVKLPTIIFDEIDTGVSGKTAERMALIMQEMAQNDRQVISITHLPQIAARGNTHYKVYKEETQQGTTSRMKQLSAQERTDEIAQMLSGADVTEAARVNARELLDRCKA